MVARRIRVIGVAGGYDAGDPACQDGAVALRRVTRHTAGYGISIDFDALDPVEGPGVGTPVAGGLLRTDLTDALALAQGDERLRALEIFEYNPYRDEHFVTARAIHDLCRSVIEI